MDWKLAIEAERAALRNIAALLFALADLAECAAGRSKAARAFVLWLLLPAVAVARNLITGSCIPASLCRPGNAPGDAMRLAEEFRDLAAAFHDLSRMALGCAEDDDSLPGGLARTSIPAIPKRICAVAMTPPEAGPMTLPSALRVWRRTPHDTS